MKTLVVTTEKRIMQALARVISLDPAEQIKWVNENRTHEAIEMLDRVSELGMESDLRIEDDIFGEGYVIAPIFIVAIEGYEGDKKVLECVHFEETVGAVQDIVLEHFMIDRKSVGLYHVFMYKANKGFVEIPFEIGYYLVEDEEVEKEDEQLEFTCVEDVPTEKPKRVFLDIYTMLGCLCDVYEDATPELFVELPGLWDVEYIGCPCCGEKKQEVYTVKNLSGALNTAISHCYNMGFDAEITVSDNWYEYKIVVDEDGLAEEIDLEQPCVLSFDALERNTKIVVRKKF